MADQARSVMADLIGHLYFLALRFSLASERPQ